MLLRWQRREYRAEFGWLQPLPGNAVAADLFVRGLGAWGPGWTPGSVRSAEVTWLGELALRADAAARAAGVWP